MILKKIFSVVFTRVWDTYPATMKPNPKPSCARFFIARTWTCSLATPPPAAKRRSEPRRFSCIEFLKFPTLQMARLFKVRKILDPCLDRIGNACGFWLVSVDRCFKLRVRGSFELSRGTESCQCSPFLFVFDNEFFNNATWPISCRLELEVDLRN